MDEMNKRNNIIEKLSDNVFVEAGAGAGKTTLIVKRIINQLRAGILPQEIVVITFTNAAAEELRGRITKEVLKAANDEAITSAAAGEAEKLREAVRYLDLMNISTIHSFCFKLLQERIFDAKLPMDVKLAKTDNTLHNRFFADWIKKLKRSDWDRLMSLGAEKYVVIGCIKSMFNVMCELPDETNIIYDRGDADKSLSDVINECENEAKLFVGEFEQLLCRLIGTAMGKTFASIAAVDDDNLLKTGKEIKTLLAGQAISYMEVLEKIKESVTTKNKFMKVTRAELADGITLKDVDKFDEYCREWRKQDAEKLIFRTKNYEYAIYMDYVLDAIKEYRKTRSKRLISNDDLLQKTRSLICDSKEAREYFAGKIKCIYVDEFQDTDHVQEEFIWKLAAKEDNPCELRDGVLFLVGDPKQSIYRFRGAEPEVYFKTKAKMESLSNAKVYQLNYNFRSNEKVISWVNKYFGQKSLCEDGEYQNMICKKGLPVNPSDKLLAGVYYYKNPVKDKGTVAAKEVEDINALKSLIRKFVDNGYQICDYDEANQPYARAIRYSDFLILCRSKRNMDDYTSAMVNAGIPVCINGEIDLKFNQVLNSYARLFDYLTHPRNPLKKAGAAECLQKNGISDEAVLEMLADSVAGMSAAGIARYLMQSPEYLLPVGKDISEIEIASVQMKLNQMVEEVLSGQENDEDIISELFWEYSQGELERELPRDIAEDAVRFMNIHKAKGLEGNIVILTKRSEIISFSEAAFHYGNDYYPECKRGTYHLWSSYHCNEEILKKAKKADDDEQMRLQYVVATRAKQAFIVMDYIRTSAMFSDFDKADATGSVKNIIEDGQPISSKTAVPVMYIAPEIKHTPEVCDNDMLQNEAVYKKTKPSDYDERVEVRRKETESDGDTEESKRPKGNIFGNAMHRSLELLIERWRRDFAKEPDLRIMKMCVNQAMMEEAENLKEEDISLYKDYLMRILSSFAKWAYETELFITAEEVYTELPFSFYEEKMQFDEGTMPAWVNGKADLIIKDKDGKYTVLDYKSDNDLNIESEEEFENVLKKRYDDQLYMYRSAIHRLLGAKEEDTRLKLLSFKGDEDMPLRCTEIK